VEALRQRYEDLEAERLEAVRQVAGVRQSLRSWATRMASDGNRSA
jgi:hypothetical protein